MNKIIKVKCWPEYFEAVAALKKPFEIRKDDRDYQVGDTLILEEWGFQTQQYTGRKLVCHITYKLTEHGGLKEGFCILGIDVWKETKAKVIDQEIKSLKDLMQH